MLWQKASACRRAQSTPSSSRTQVDACSVADGGRTLARLAEAREVMQPSSAWGGILQLLLRRGAAGIPERVRAPARVVHRVRRPRSGTHSGARGQRSGHQIRPVRGPGRPDDPNVGLEPRDAVQRGEASETRRRRSESRGRREPGAATWASCSGVKIDVRDLADRVHPDVGATRHHQPRLDSRCGGRSSPAPLRVGPARCAGRADVAQPANSVPS